MPRSLIVIGVIVALDLLLRFVVPLAEATFRTAEGVVYLVGAAALAVTASGMDRDEPGGRGLEGWVAAIFALVGLRYLLWGLGVPVAVGNLVILIAAVAALGAWLWRRRR